MTDEEIVTMIESRYRNVKVQGIYTHTSDEITDILAEAVMTTRTGEQIALVFIGDTGGLVALQASTFQHLVNHWISQHGGQP